MTIALSLLIFIAGLLAVYIGILQYQLHSMNNQLDKRLREKTRQPLSLELINPELNHLAANMNKSLKAEETLRLSGIREEKQFKEMIANISHDLRTPLTAIKGYQQLMEKGELTEDQQAKLHTAQKHADELGNLIQHFFEYSYLLNIASEPEIEGFNLTNLVTECLAESVAVFEENNLSLIFKEGPSVFAYGDQDMTTRIVRNLIRNCIAHSAGDVRVDILAEEHAVISFKNSLTNPEETDITQLFDRFYTADKARGKTSGLGLSIVKSLTEKMNGHTKANLQECELEIRIELPLWERPL